MEYLISDTHYFHKNIIEFESNTRGHLKSTDEMNESLIEQWNNIVTPEDTVYHLGDISIISKYELLTSVLSRLNGKIILVQGNHDDTKVVKKLLRDGYIEDYHEVGIRLKRRKQTMWLTHYPMNIGERKNMWSVHGHIHSEPSKYRNQINVGVDSNFMLDTMGLEFGQPVKLDDVVEYMVNNPVKSFKDYVEEIKTLQSDSVKPYEALIGEDVAVAISNTPQREVTPPTTHINTTLHSKDDQLEATKQILKQL